MLEKLTKRAAILKAVAKCDELGSKSFLSTYGFGPAERYHLLHADKYYDSKVIVGVAYRIQHNGNLNASNFSGGIKTVVPKLRSLGFQVVADPIIENFVALPEEAEASD